MYSVLIVLLLINNVLTDSIKSTEIKIEQNVLLKNIESLAPPGQPVPLVPPTSNALYLTDYLKDGNYLKAQELARVPFTCSNGFESVKSYSGYFTVNKEYNSNLHVWYFTAQRKPETAPIIFYLQPGPSLSAMYAVFSLGPFKINDHLELECRQHHWAEKYHMVFIENPVDTGFSFTNLSDGLVETPMKYTNDLYSAFQQFYQMFPQLKQNNFYITSNSYGARYGSHLGERILQKKEYAANLRGVIFASPFIDGLHQVDWSDYLYNLGLINSKDLKRLVQLQNKLKKEIRNEEWKKSFETYGKLMYVPNLNGSLIGNLTGYSSAFNYLYTIHDNTTERRIIEYVTRSQVRSALHVEQQVKFKVEDAANIKASGLDAMHSGMQQVLYILKSNRTVLFYNGQLDMYVPYVLTANVLKHMDEYGTLYDGANRRKWYISNKICTNEMIKQWGYCADNLAGYITEVKKYGKLVHALIRGAGHFVAQDQDIRTRALFNLYVN